jgi:hypothetical protein
MAVFLAIGAELREQFFLCRLAELDMVHPHAEVVFVAAIGDIDIAIVANAHGLRIVETGSVGRAAPDGITPIVCTAFDEGCKRHRALPLLRVSPSACRKVVRSFQE